MHSVVWSLFTEKSPCFTNQMQFYASKLATTHFYIVVDERMTKLANYLMIAAFRISQEATRLRPLSSFKRLKWRNKNLQSSRIHIYNENDEHGVDFFFHHSGYDSVCQRRIALLLLHYRSKSKPFQSKFLYFFQCKFWEKGVSPDKSLSFCSTLLYNNTNKNGSQGVENILLFCNFFFCILNKIQQCWFRYIISMQTVQRTIRTLQIYIFFFYFESEWIIINIILRKRVCVRQTNDGKNWMRKMRSNDYNDYNDSTKFLFFFSSLFLITINIARSVIMITLVLSKFCRHIKISGQSQQQ